MSSAESTRLFRVMGSFFLCIAAISLLATYSFAGSATLTVSGTQWGVSTAYLGANEGSSQFNINDLGDLGINTSRLYGGMSRWEPTDDSSTYGSPSIAQIEANPGVINWAFVTGRIDNNTVYNVAARPGSTGMFNGTGGAFTSSIYAKSGSPNVQIYNNNFISDGTLNSGADDTIVWGDGKGTFVFNNNAWHRVEGGDDWYWSGDTTSFSGWQAKGFDSVGMDVDPQINRTLGGGPVAYQLNSTSPLINKGANLSGSAPGGVGTRDYFGNPIPNGGSYDIGAADYTGSYSTQQSNATPVAHTSFSPSAHIAAIRNNGQNIAKGAAASWSVTIMDSSGNPVSV